MKTIKISLLAATLVFFSSTGIAQSPPHPNNGGAPSGNTTVGGNQGGAPVGNGNIILFTLALAYGGLRMHNRNKAEKAIAE